MATLAQLMKYGSVGTSGGFDFKLDLPASKFKWDSRKLIRKVGEARAKALRRVGLVVKDRTKRVISSRSPRKNPKRVKVGTRFGLDLIALVDRVPKPDVVTSWRTSRFPKGMLRQDIQSDYDTRTQSVVVGPAKFPKLNVLHEAGGVGVRYFKPVPIRVPGNRVLGILTNTPPKRRQARRDKRGRLRYRMVEEANPPTFRIRVKPRPYMARGLAKAMPRIPQEFRDQIRGP
jgi:hypothetical protein